MHRKRIFIPIILIVIASMVIYWYSTTQKDKPVTSSLTVSGTVETTTVTISPEIFGRVAEVRINEGERVKAGDTLFLLDPTIIDAQLAQARINLNAAEIGMDVAQKSYAAAQVVVDIAQAQYDLTLAQALQQAQPARSSAWQQETPTEFDQPLWYYTHAEQMTAAQDELNSSKTALEGERASFDALKSTDSYADLTSTETRLALARVAFLNARDVLVRSELQGDQSLIDTAQQAYDEASSELDEAQSAYTEFLSSEKAQDVLDARARLAVAQERYDSAQDRYNALQTGRDSLQVLVAAASIAQAQTNLSLAESKLSQAQVAIDQAQAAIDLIQIQREKLSITSPVSGIVLARNIEPGETVQPGGSALTLGELDKLTITVYIPENRYGEVSMGEQAQVKVDSFPNQSFTATVIRIADQAEFTPRNVQTVEGRSTTVYAVQLAVQDPDRLLKPGMPADVSFDQP